MTQPNMAVQAAHTSFTSHFHHYSSDIQSKLWLQLIVLCFSGMFNQLQNSKHYIYYYNANCSFYNRYWYWDTRDRRVSGHTQTKGRTGTRRRQGRRGWRTTMRTMRRERPAHDNEDNGGRGRRTILHSFIHLASMSGSSRLVLYPPSIIFSFVYSLIY